MNERIYASTKGNIHYFVQAADKNAPWLIFLPGLSADHSLFEKQTEHFACRYNCLVWDAPAHGKSRPFELTFTMRDMAAYLHEIMKKEGVVNPILIGQSLGGYVAQVYMDEYPDTVIGFISIDSCSMSRKYYTWLEIALLKRTKWMYLSIPYKMLIKWGVAGTAVTSYGRELMAKMWSVYDKQEYCALADHGYKIFAQAVEERAEYPLRCPVLLICGEKDGAGSAKSYNRRWNKLDGHRLEWIKNAGHNANTDAPEEINRLIDSFVCGIMAEAAR